jgi:hypothetical protein
MSLVGSWDFDVVKLDNVSGGRPLVVVADKLFQICGLYSRFKISQSTGLSFFTVIYFLFPFFKSFRHQCPNAVRAVFFNAMRRVRALADCSAS